jgi:hypothetical protein
MAWKSDPEEARKRSICICISAALTRALLRCSAPPQYYDPPGGLLSYEPYIDPALLANVRP